MRDNTKVKAPQPSIPSKKHPMNSFKESDKIRKGNSPMSPLSRKRLSK